MNYQNNRLKKNQPQIIVIIIIAIIRGSSTKMIKKSTYFRNTSKIEDYIFYKE